MGELETNVLYYGDNLDILRKYIPDESVDLVYLDPPFNSNRDYNVIFKDESGRKSDAQLLAFEDTWHWGPSVESTYNYLTNTGLHQGRVPESVSAIIGALRRGIGTNQVMAYLVEMAVRLVELRRVLKPTGALYLHCDPTASHYLKVVLDGIFGPEHFVNEIVWRRTGAHGKTRRYSPLHDVILFYAKTSEHRWTPPKRPYMRGHVDEYFVRDEHGWRTNYYGNVLTGSGLRAGESGQAWRGIDPSAKGRHWAIPGALLKDVDEDLSQLSQHEKLDRLYQLGHVRITPGQAWPMYERRLAPEDGQAVGDMWAYQPYTEGSVFGTTEGIDADVRWLSPRDQERLGWPTQKPLGLLERIVEASSNPGDLVLDPFCGCGTALVAAQKLGRRWIGIDITYLSIAVMRARLRDSFPDLGEIKVIGLPTEVEGARMLAAQSLEGRYEFQYWALSLVDAQPIDRKKGADAGIDGRITFTDVGGRVRNVLVSVKSGHVNVSQVRDLIGTMQREEAPLGIFITLEEPSKPMLVETASAGVFYSELSRREYPKVQILTIAELLGDKRPSLPLLVLPTYEQAQRVERKAAEQRELFGGR